MDSMLPDIRQRFATGTLSEPRMTSMIKSIISHAFNKPSNSSALFFCWRSKTEYLRWMISRWKSSHVCRISLKDMVSGFFFLIANRLTPNVSSNFVFLYKIFVIRSISAPLRSSNTMRMPSLFVWLEMSMISGNVLSVTRDATSFKNLLMPEPTIVYGISVITSLSWSPRPVDASNPIVPRILSFPVPVS